MTKILHLFPKLLSLYGEYGNVKILEMLLKEQAYEVEVTGWEEGEVDFSQYDFCYVGSGTEDNLMVALERLRPHACEVKASIEKNTLWLATGNALALFGKTVTRKDRTVPGIGAFDFETLVDDSKRYLGDVLSTGGALGFINTSCVFTGIDTPLLELKLGKTLGNDKKSCQDGLRQGNFHATQLIGPFLVKNPQYLKDFFTILTDHPWAPDRDSNLMLAYKTARKELEARLSN